MDTRAYRRHLHIWTSRHGRRGSFLVVDTVIRGGQWLALERIGLHKCAAGSEIRSMAFLAGADNTPSRRGDFSGSVVDRTPHPGMLTWAASTIHAYSKLCSVLEEPPRTAS